LTNDKLVKLKRPIRIRGSNIPGRVQGAIDIHGDIIGEGARKQGTQLIIRAIQHVTSFDVLFLAVDVDAERGPLRHDVEIDIRTGIRRGDEREPLIRRRGQLGLIRSIAGGDLNVPSAAPCDFIAALGYADISEPGASGRCGLGRRRNGRGRCCDTVREEEYKWDDGANSLDCDEAP